MRRREDVLPPEDECLASLGEFIRAVRVTRGINQGQAAKDAGVSRKQLILLEKGGNVSVKFLLRVARCLGLTDIPLDGNVQLVSGQQGVNVFEITQTLDLVIALADRARSFTFEAVLPPSERRTLRHTPALREFIARHHGDAEHLAAALANLAEDVGGDPTATSPKFADKEEVPLRTVRRSRRRKGA
jgi:transcriptional regulator with XRE-family HTH domain